jgi:hypothetical protein
MANFPQEIEWLNDLQCGRITASDLSSTQKEYVAHLVVDDKFTREEVQTTYHISKSTLAKWIRYVNAGRKILDQGRPNRITDEHLKELVEFVSDKDDIKTNAEFEKKVNELARESNNDRGLNPLAHPVNKRTLGRIEQRCHIEEATAEKTTKARHDAVSCARNAVSFLALNYALTQYIEAGLIFNADATQFRVGYTDKKTERVKILVELVIDDPVFPQQATTAKVIDQELKTDEIELETTEAVLNESKIDVSLMQVQEMESEAKVTACDESKMDISPMQDVRETEIQSSSLKPIKSVIIPATIIPDYDKECRKDGQHGPLKIVMLKIDEGLTAYFIKYYLLINAAGMTGNPVFIIADRGMKDNTIDVHECPDLYTTPDCKLAYIVFCKSRQCNSKFYEWFNSIVLIPMVSEVRVFLTMNIEWRVFN